MGKVDLRDVSPFLKSMRNFLLGRSHVTALRFEQDLASRSPDPPNLPDGVHHSLHTNYYYKRDARRTVEKPTLVTSAQPKLQDGSAQPAGGKLRTPGSVHQWD